MSTLTLELLHILQHSLGVDQYGQGEMYRNRFCAGGKDIDKCKELTSLGYMVERTPVFNDPWWSVTEEGIKAVLEQSPKPKPMGDVVNGLNEIKVTYCSEQSDLNDAVTLIKSQQAELEAAKKDVTRIDFLASTEQFICNVQMPREIVEANLTSLRDAIDVCMAQTKKPEESK